MSVIIQLQNLPLSASSIDIRDFFKGLNIPPGGVHIIGGKKGSAFIAFANDEDARQAMEKNGRRIKDARIKLGLSSHRELKQVLEQLHKEQSEYEMSRKVRLSESRPERNRSHPKHRRSRSRSLERNRSHQEIDPDNHNGGGKYDDGLQRENPTMRQQSPYDRHSERKVQYAENSVREFLGSSGTDRPNPYVSSTYASDPEEERNEEIRRRIETFIATFGQAENYNLDLKTDTYPSKALKTSHDEFLQPGGKEVVQHNRSQGYPSIQAPVESYPFKMFDDFDTRRHFDDLHPESNVIASEALQGHPVSSMNASYNLSREQNERMPYNVDGQNFSSQTNYNALGDHLLNSPMDIEEEKTDDGERFQPNQYLGPHVFGASEEVSKVQSESASVPIGSASFNLLPYQNFENPGGDLRPNVFEIGSPEVTSTDAAKDFCIKLEGLPYYITENDVKRVFRDQNVFDMFIPYTFDGKACGIGFVQFSSAEDLHAAIRMKYCMIGESRVEFRGSSRAALMEARMHSVSSIANSELSSSYQDVFSLKRTQDMLSSIVSGHEPAMSSSHPAIPPTYPTGPASYPAAPSTNQQQTGPPSKRSLCAVITGLPSHFIRHIQVLKCIEDMGINFHLIHLVLNNRSRFTGKVFAEFHDLRDLDAALKKHNQNVEGWTIGVKQVLHEEMLKFLNSHKNRCMYPTPNQQDYLEKKPEKAPYIWEPPYEVSDKPSATDTPAVWSSKRAMENRRFGTSGDFFSQNETVFQDHFNGAQAFNRDLDVGNSYASGSSHQKSEIDQFPHADRMNTPNTRRLYSGFNKGNDSFQGEADFFHGSSEMDFPERERKDFVSPLSVGEKGFNSRKKDSSSSQFSRDKHCRRSCSPINYGKRKDFPEDHKRFRNQQHGGEQHFPEDRKRFRNQQHGGEQHFPEDRKRFRNQQHGGEQHFPEDRKRFRNEQHGDEISGTVFLDPKLKTRLHLSHHIKQGILVETRDEGLKEFSTGQMAEKLNTDVSSAKMKEATNTPAKKRSGGTALPQKSFTKTQSSNEQSLKPKHGGKMPSDITSPKSSKKRFEHRKNCPKRQKNQPVETDLSRPHDHPKPKNCSQSSDRSRPIDHSRPIDDFRTGNRPRRDNRSRSNDRLRSERSRLEDRTRPSDRSRLEDRTGPSDRSRLEDRTRPSDRSRLEDRTRPSDRSRLGDHSRPNDHPKHRSEQKEFRKEAHGTSRPEDLFKQPGCVLEATNVDPHLGLYELLDFFRGYGLHSENLIRRYTDSGEPTGDLRIAFHHPEDADQAYKILNRQYLKGRTVLLSFVST